MQRNECREMNAEMSDNFGKKISVIITSYNAENYVDKCLESLKNQRNADISNFEIVFVDDGSSDSTYRKAYEFISEHKIKNAILVKQKNMGSIRARINGVQKANGEFITFVDVDDFVASDYISKILFAIQTNADIYFLNNKINKKRDNKFDIEKNFLIDGYIEKDEAYKLVLTGKAGAVWDKVYKRELFINNIDDFYIDIFWGEDVFINSKFLVYAKKISVRNIDVYFHYIDSPVSNSITNSNPQKKIQDIDNLYKAEKELFEETMFNQKVFSEFCEVYLVNIAKIVGAMVDSRIKKSDIKKMLCSRSILKYEIDNIRSAKKSNKFYILLLKKQRFGLLAILNKVRNFLK